MQATTVATWTFDISSTAIVAATIAGPILAVQAQKWLERGRAINERRATIFRVLMATRAARLSPGHVEALNAIPVEFYGPNKAKLKEITDAWQSYLDALSDDTLSHEASTMTRMNHFVDLLHLMSKYLGYDFSKSEISKNVYTPTGHINIETDQETIRRGFVSVLRGETSIPMNVTGFPYDEEAAAKQATLNERMLEWFEGQRTVKVESSK